MFITQFLTSEIEARRTKNLEYLKKVSPHFYQFMNLKGEVKAQVIYHLGRWDLLVNGVSLYGGDARLNTRRQFEDYLKTPNEFSSPFYVFWFPEDTVDGKLSHELTKLLAPAKSADRCKQRKTVGTVIAFGVGLGFHIELLTEHYDIKQLILVETDVELIKPTLYTLDWEKLLSVYNGKDRIISFYLHKDPDLLAVGLLDHLTAYYNPTLLTHFHIYMHRNDPVLIEGAKKFWASNKSPIAGFGYFQDELWSLEYTLENIKKELPLYQAKKKVPSDSTAFVIGAGPSLEYALDFIKKNQERAVIFSCGSSIGTLYEEGIKPDFHVEIERTKFTYDALLQSASRDYLKELTVIFNNPMYPQVSELFKESLMFVKPNDTGGSLFPPEYPPVGYSNPTVVNAGLSLALHMGFKRVYLFGVDMGYKDPRKHHAKGNVALKEGSEFYKESEAQEHELEGNFGGKVYTNSMLLWARSMIQDLLKLYKDAEVFNTSDGAKIEGTIPARIDELSLSKFKKSEVVKLIKQDFSRDYLKALNLERKLSLLISHAEEYMNFVRERTKSISKPEDFFSFVSEAGLYQYRFYGSPFIYMFRPPFYNFSYALLSGICRMEQDQALEAGKTALKLYIDFLHECIKLIKKSVKYLS
ncbi:MAG: DUF115 domain-containing protein [Hydrogenobacter thermophilus]|uniref:motility associated factor glycosyltransferase family protein n=1 Tax=Hydrogenobacter thermophilus TaxID=940 RepID=UPI001C74C165|nr:6-hydroxymethylpterin diphosphokinase MptE-like protein [Hydrogenobacter thermophilus]QWK19976.1 MAG: DUF115 domain-containing protein [Hydrogenobacter thermophilus]